MEHVDSMISLYIQKSAPTISWHVGRLKAEILSRYENRMNTSITKLEWTN